MYMSFGFVHTALGFLNLKFISIFH